jgi:hypothetical protein
MIRRVPKAARIIHHVRHNGSRAWLASSLNWFTTRMQRWGDKFHYSDNAVILYPRFVGLG